MRSGLLMTVIGALMVPMGMVTVANYGIEPRISFVGAVLLVGGVAWMTYDISRKKQVGRGFEVIVKEIEKE